DLVAALDRDPGVEVLGLRYVLDRAGQAAHRAQRGTGDEQPDRGGDQHAERGDSGQQDRHAAQRVVDLLHRPADDERGVGVDVPDVDAQRGAVVGVAVVELPLAVDAGGDAPLAPGDLDRGVAHDAAVAAGEDDL